MRVAESLSIDVNIGGPSSAAGHYTVPLSATLRCAADSLRVSAGGRMEAWRTLLPCSNTAHGANE